MSEKATIASTMQSQPAALPLQAVAMPLFEVNKEPLQRLPIQRKLSVGAVDDPLELEADAMADKVMRMPNQNFIQHKCSTCNEEDKKIHRKPLISFIQRKCNHCEEDDDGIAQRKPLVSFIQKKENGNSDGNVNDAVANQISATKEGGSSMDGQTQSFMESRFGTNFQAVRVHTGSYASELSEHLNAQAFTVGNNVYFNEGKYQPNCDAGKHLLAHELAHTIQQNTGLSVQRSLNTLSQPVRNRLVYWNIKLWDNSTDLDPLRPAVLNDYFKISPPNSQEGSVGQNVFDTQTTTVVTPSTVYSVQRGLESIPGYMVNVRQMPLNAYINARMDLSAFGGRSGIFRFIYVNTSTARDADTHPTTEFHIEFLSALPAAAAATSRPATIAIGNQTFTAVGSWPDGMYDDLLIALNLLPQAVRTQINGQRFRYRSNFSRTAAESDEDGHVTLDSDASHTQEIDVFRSTTASAINTYGTYSRTVYTILHEIGHVLDFQPIRDAFAAGGASNADSLSGFFRWNSRTSDFVEGQSNRTAYGTAVGSSRSITSYAATDRKESFAEYFAMYVVDRSTLQLLRPDIYTYFNHRYP